MSLVQVAAARGLPFSRQCGVAPVGSVVVVGIVVAVDKPCLAITEPVAVLRTFVVLSDGEQALPSPSPDG
jgi:hypothetical protein